MTPLNLCVKMPQTARAAIRPLLGGHVLLFGAVSSWKLHNCPFVLLFSSFKSYLLYKNILKYGIFLGHIEYVLLFGSQNMVNLMLFFVSFMLL